MSVLTLTAQAVQGDRERVPGRGLDSYRSKQVNVVKLVHTVRQPCPDVGREGPPPARLLWHWRTLELSRAFPLAATAGRDGQPLPTGWK
jgi:hypothetical protein